MIDTLSIYKRLLTAGTSKAQAEAFIEIIVNDYIAEDMNLMLVSAGFNEQQADIIADVIHQIRNKSMD